MKKFVTLLLLSICIANYAQTPVFNLDFETDDLPNGVTLFDGAVAIDTTDGKQDLLDPMVTIQTPQDRQIGLRALQMANSGYIRVDKSLFTKDDFTLSFWARWVDERADDGQYTGSAILTYAGFVNIIGTNDADQEKTVANSIDAHNSNELRVNGARSKADAGLNDADDNRTWSYLTLTSSATGLTLYVNGTLAKEKVHYASLTDATSEAMIIGTKMNDEWAPKTKTETDTLRYFGFCGYLDDVALYDEVLTEAQISTLYTTSVAIKTIDVTEISLGATSDIHDIIVGQTLQLSATVTPYNATYSDVVWSVEGAGASIDQNGLLTSTSSGTVTVKATATDNTEVYGSYQVNMSVATSLENNSAENVIVYPNPTSDYLYVESNVEGRIQILNTTGIVVYSQPYSSEVSRIDVANFNKGIYIVRLESKESTYVQRVLIK